MDQCIEMKMRELLESNLYMKDLQIEMEAYREGYAKGSVPVRDSIVNPYGSVHGGALYALADIISGMAACSYGFYSSTVNGSMNYLKPAMRTKRITCEARVVRDGKSISVYDVVLRNDDGDVIGTGTFTFYMMNRPVL